MYTCQFITANANNIWNEKQFWQPQAYTGLKNVVF